MKCCPGQGLRVFWWLKMREVNVVSLARWWACTKTLPRSTVFAEICLNFVKVTAWCLLRISPRFSPIGQKLESQEAWSWPPFLHDKMVEWEIVYFKNWVKLNDFELEASRNIESSWNFAHLFISCVQWFVQSLVSIRHEISWPGDSETEGVNQLFASCTT